MPGSDNDKTVVLGGAGAPRTAGGQTARVGRSQNALPVGTQLSEFEIVGLVGEGGFGIVYLADDRSLQRRVAIKEYMPSSLATRGDDASVIVRSERHVETFEVGRKSFVNEARLLAQFDHPALVKVYRYWEANGTAYMAMPYYAGKTLRDVFKGRSERPGEGWIRRMLVPIMDALELIHSSDCFHRDIAPDNIMLLKDERPVLLDFGAARRVISDMTQALTVILKPGYAPIEQYADMPGMKQGPWTDIYALAAVVHYLVTGQVPPPSVNRIMKDQYEPLARVAAGRYSEQFLEAIDQCLSVRSEDRPGSIAEMRQLIGIDSAGTPPAGQPFAEQAAADLEPTRLIVEPSARQHGSVETQTASTDATRLIATAPEQSVLPGSPAEAVAPPAPVAAAPAPGAPAKWRRIASRSVAAIAALGVLVGLTSYYLTRQSTPPVLPAQPPPVPAQPEALPPRAAVSLAEAFALALAGSNSEFGLRVSIPKASLVVDRDALSFTLSSQRAGYVYVLLWDKATNLLDDIFPNEYDKANRLGAGQSLKFPRPDWAYQADRPVGDWDVLVIVSENPRNFPYLRTAHANGSGRVGVDLIEKELNQATAGAAALVGEAVCRQGEACSDAYAAARFVVKETESTSASGTAASGRKGDAEDRSPASGKGTKGHAQPLDKALEEMLRSR